MGKKVVFGFIVLTGWLVFSAPAYAVNYGSGLYGSGLYGAATYTITASAGAGGSISPSGSAFVVQAGSQAFTITPDSGYNIATLVVDSVSVSTSTTYTFSNVTADHTIAATFEAVSVAAPAAVTAPASSASLSGRRNIAIPLLVSTTTPAIPELLAQLAELTRILNGLKQSPSFSFTKPLVYGMTNPEVKQLQRTLNVLGFTVASGLDLAGLPLGGSPGHETDFFGARTLQAVKAFQLKHAIISSLDDSAGGLVGPKTRAKLNILQGVR